MASPGIRTRHSRTCRTVAGGGCNCEPTYEAWVYSKRDDKKIRKSFPTLAAAKGWRTDAAKQVQDRRLRATSSRTLRQEVDEWLSGARSGEIRNRREQPYKPAVIRNYELALRLRVLDELGDRRLADIDFADLLELKEHLQGTGVSGSTIRNTFVPLQAIYRRARRAGRVAVNPTLDLGLPTAGSRDRAATPTQALELLGHLADIPQALWASAFFAGLRRGELRALRVRNVDLEAATLKVEHSWDDREGEIAPKSRAGARSVFVLDGLRPYLEPLVDGRQPDEHVFGVGLVPFEPRAVVRKAERALNAVDKAAAQRTPPGAPVDRLTLHEARHSFATWLDHAGISPDRADRYMGHSSGSVASRYRHLLGVQVAADRDALDAYLVGATSGKVVSIGGRVAV
jgi:integrase